MPDENQSTDANDNFGSAKSHAKEAAGVARDHLKQAADDLRAAAENKAREFRGKAEQFRGEATARVRTFQEDGEEYVRANPAKAVLCALGAGFLLGLMFRE
jgi:ElaB/YqjD/DUF883 family membrane-anchored ribosome-binding protein